MQAKALSSASLDHMPKSKSPKDKDKSPKDKDKSKEVEGLRAQLSTAQQDLHSLTTQLQSAQQYAHTHTPTHP